MQLYKHKMELNPLFVLFRKLLIVLINNVIFFEN